MVALVAFDMNKPHEVNNTRTVHMFVFEAKSDILWCDMKSDDAWTNKYAWASKAPSRIQCYQLSECFRASKGCSHQLACPGPVMERCFLPPSSFHPACSPASSRMAGKCGTIRFALQRQCKGHNFRAICSKWRSSDSSEPLICLTAQTPRHPLFSSSAGSKANSRDDLSLR
jgi:hypothetical protein